MSNPYANSKVIDQFKGVNDLEYSQSRNEHQAYSRNPMVAESKGQRPPVYKAEIPPGSEIPKVVASDPKRLIKDIQTAKERQAIATMRFAAYVNSIVPARKSHEQVEAEHQARLLADYRKNHGDNFITHLLGVLKPSNDWYVDQARQRLTALLASPPCNVAVNN